MEKKVNISLLLESFHQLEKAYADLKKNLSVSVEEFLSNPLLQDKVRVDFNLAFESSMRPCRHLSVLYGLKTSSKDCLVKLAEYIGMQNLENLKAITDFYFRYRDLKEPVDPKELYSFLKENLDVFKEYARWVVEHVKKTTGNVLLIDFDLLNEKAKYLKDSIRKIEFVLSQGREEFAKRPMYYDRARYFYTVAYDSLFEICKHLAPKWGVKKFGDDCLIKLVQIGVIPPEYEEKIQKLTRLRNRLLNTWEISPDELYQELADTKDTMEPILKHISSALRKLLEEKRTVGKEP